MGGKNSYESIKRYQDKAYDKTLIRLPKGQLAIIKDHAAAAGESVNAYITASILQRMERDTSGGTAGAGTGPG